MTLEEAEELLRQLEADPEQINASGLQLRDKGANVVGDRELGAALRDANADRMPEREEDDDVPGDYSWDPGRERPKFGQIPTINDEVRSKEIGEKVYRSSRDKNRAKLYEGRDESGKKQEAEIAEMQKLLKDFEGSQNEQRGRQRRARTSAHTLNAGEAVSSAFANRPMHYTETPEKYDVAKAKETQLNLGDKLKNTQKRYEDQDLDRLLKEYEGDERNDTLLSITERKEAGKDERQDEKLTYDEKKTNKTEAGKMERTKILARSGLAGRILAMYSSANNQGNRADSEYANKQATYQIPGWDQIKPNSPTDHSTGAELAGAEEAFWQVGKKLSQGMRTNGRAFPESTEWKNVAGDYMALNQALNHLNRNGVMNFKDKDNNDVQIGNAQQLVQYVMDNGPEVLDHALDTMRLSTDSQLGQRGYKRHVGEWSAKNPNQYLPNSSTGGGGARNPIDPNAVQGLGPWVEKGGTPPAIVPPGAQPQTPPIPAPGAKPGGQRYLTVDEQGNPVVRYQ